METSKHLPAVRSSVSVSLAITTLPELREFCAVLAATEMVPKAYKGKADDILVAMLHGQEVGLPHLQALQSIAVVNGIPSIYGDAALALVRASGKLEMFDEWIEVDGVRQDGPFPILSDVEGGKKVVAFCRSKREGMEQRTTTYSVDDAGRAGLWKKAGTWTTVPQRMLMWRARGWNLRDQFGDVLKGLAIYEEAMDITPESVKVVVVDPNADKLAVGKAALASARGDAPPAPGAPEPVRTAPASAPLVDNSTAGQDGGKSGGSGEPPSLPPVSDFQLAQPRQVLAVHYDEGVRLLQIIEQNFGLEPGSYPADPYTRQQLLEAYWEGCADLNRWKAAHPSQEKKGRK